MRSAPIGSPGAMSVMAKPMVVSYLRMGSPLAMAREAILLPALTACSKSRPLSSIGTPGGRSMRATTRLSAGCMRITGLSMTTAAGLSKLMVSPGDMRRGSEGAELLWCAEAAGEDPAAPLLHHLVQGRLRALGSAGARFRRPRAVGS